MGRIDIVIVSGLVLPSTFQFWLLPGVVPTNPFQVEKVVREKDLEFKKGSAGCGQEQEMPPLPGFLTVRVLRGVNLVSRDATGSDPYVVLNLDNQKVKTSVIKKTVNPVWNEDLTLAVRNAATPIKLEVFDKDTFSKDDRMGDAEFDIEALMQIIQMDLEDIRSGTVVRTVRPSKQCCLADESRIIWENGQLVQDILLKLR